MKKHSTIIALASLLIIIITNMFPKLFPNIGNLILEQPLISIMTLIITIQTFTITKLIRKQKTLYNQN
ncbi:hypothetical protein COJ58_25050 [Bacillus thuringiensis]|nr:hypothetical protein COJ58_25050 [Bacillus thuringiensis]